MKLRFLGTRGNIDPSNSNHKRHSSLKGAYYQHKIIIDCGKDWLGQVPNWKADAIFITHAHQDHAFGLKHGAPCPVYATNDAWDGLEEYQIKEKKVIPERE